MSARLVDVHGVAFVLVAPEVASRIARPLRIAVESVLRRDGLDASPEVRGFLADLDRAGRGFRERKRPDVLVSGGGNALEGVPETVGAATAAKALNVSSRRVGQLCAGGYLDGDKNTSGAWSITVASIIELQEDRTREQNRRDSHST